MSEVSTTSEGDFMRLFVKHEPALRAYARTLLPNWHAVDDALQEASVVMWQKIDQLQDESGFLPWGKVIVRFKCLSAITKLRKDHHLLSDSVLDMLAQESEEISAEEHASARNALRECLQNFKDDHRHLLLAPYSGDGEVMRIAERMGKTANALYKLLGRLRGKLGDCVKSKITHET